MTVGCLTQAPDNSWTLTNAVEPVRNKKLDESNPRDVVAFQGKIAGTLTFRLPNAALQQAEAHKGHQMLVKGVLGRNPAGDRINITSMQMISASCGP